MIFFSLITSERLLGAEGRSIGPHVTRSETNHPLPTGMSPSSELGLWIGAGVLIAIIILALCRKWLPYLIWDTTKAVVHFTARLLDVFGWRAPVNNDIPMNTIPAGGANPVEGPQHSIPETVPAPSAPSDTLGESASQNSSESITPTMVEQEAQIASTTTLAANDPTPPPHSATPTVRPPRPAPTWRWSDLSKWLMIF